MATSASSGLSKACVSATADAGGTEFLEQRAVGWIAPVDGAPIGEQLVVIGVQLQDALRQVLDAANAASEVRRTGADACRHLGKCRGGRRIPRPLACGE